MVWFDTILNSLKEQTDHPIIECIQEPGEIVFVPGGNFMTPFLGKN